MANNKTSYYDILGVDKLADNRAIKKAYHTLSIKLHPDKLPNEKKLFGEAKIKEINEAYSILSDPTKRKIYDKYGKEGLEKELGQCSYPMSGFRYNTPSIKIPLKMTLEELYLGKSVTIDFERKNICVECDRTGTKDKSMHKCAKCNGIGKTIQLVRKGPFIQEQLIDCYTCKGLGIDPKTELCAKCKGKCYITEKCTVTQELHPGTNENVIIHNIGDELPIETRPPGMERGDVVLIIEEKEHDVFQRYNEADLLVKIKLSIEEALCGFKRVITHLDGRKLAIIELEPTNFGARKIVRNEGMKLPSGTFGDLIIQFTISMPTSLNERQKDMIYSGLTYGRNFDCLDLSVGSDEVYTHLISVGTGPESDSEPLTDAKCRVQ